MFEGRRILVTGGGGFIGSHLVKRLVELNADVNIVARNIKNLWRLKEVLPVISIHSADIQKREEIDFLVSNIKPEYIFHLSAYGVSSEDRDIYKALDTNVYGIIHVLNAGIKYGCKRFINIGTCAEYGNKKDSITEDFSLNPVDIYGSTKAAATVIAHQIAGENHIEIVTLRLFGVFGEYESRHKIFCHAIMTLLEDKDLELTSCSQIRDYCYVQDIIEAIIRAAADDKVANEVFNVGSGEAYPLKYYIELIHDLMKSKRKLLFGALEDRRPELWHPIPDICKIKRKLGWRPEKCLDENLLKTISWYKNNFQYYIKKAEIKGVD